MKHEIIIDIPNHLDVSTSPELKNILFETISDVEAISTTGDIILDFSKTELVTSAGLRVLMQAQKNVQASSINMTMKNISPEVMEVFNITGVSKIFNIL